ncbi:hypothetical protein EVAR_76682_1 [Eumeta japonica]|uniref:Uncharacterized protein n=1 Tax=Eumeta variegata TaxID=151549 RepID=A0A4C1SVG9_EUMVA|nr:hypothetical protein EVAR_76682_1 [Eumeta japonica]
MNERISLVAICVVDGDEWSPKQNEGVVVAHVQLAIRLASLRSRHIVDLALSESDQSLRSPGPARIPSPAIPDRSSAQPSPSSSTSSPQFKRPKTCADFNQPKNQAQADSEWGVDGCGRMHVGHQEIADGAINKLGKPEKFFTRLLDPESGSSYDDSEFSDDDDAEYLVTSAKKKIQQNLSNDEELPPQVVGVGKRRVFVHPVGAVKDYDSPYDAFIDIFDVDIMKEIVIETNRYAHQVIDKAKAVVYIQCHRAYNDKQPLPNAKASNRLLPVTNQLLTGSACR